MVLALGSSRAWNAKTVMTTNDRSEQMAVIGAGPVGLAVAKALRQLGILYEQLEADDD